ncbi:MAG TPA: hypothetical protein VNR42_08300 [Solirubrobacteraceae bacterium]|nr:hypothetical protein [Solirubrobacteraceae bacterium]
MARRSCSKDIAAGQLLDGLLVPVGHHTLKALDLEPDGALQGMITRGWPRVLSSMKTLLETGETLGA